jgi:hypothetical protein
VQDGYWATLFLAIFLMTTFSESFILERNGIAWALACAAVTRLLGPVWARAPTRKGRPPAAVRRSAPDLEPGPAGTRAGDLDARSGPSPGLPAHIWQARGLAFRRLGGYWSGMTDYTPQQIVARGARADAEAAADAIDNHPGLEGATYSILEEDEDKGLWRIDAFPTNDEEDAGLLDVLAGYPLKVVREQLADADWLAMALSGLPPVRAGRFFVYGMHDRGRLPASTVNLRIEAGAAFGTGHHGTTVGCLMAYDKLIKARKFNKVLDVGAGTGLLAIAAARTGSRSRSAPTSTSPACGSPRRTPRSTAPTPGSSTPRA